ncbi:uncharacterized protein, partial [Heptranchias perlo]|uniref:uncharacterized protein n=1 Tax=Heptranchias perlo TaxID=212740 RepID=UPI0035595D02
MARDLLCAFHLSIECGDVGLTVKPWAPKMQCYVSITPQWWSLDFKDESSLHVTLAYDMSGKNKELEDFYRSCVGTEWEVIRRAMVTGPEGRAEYVEIPSELWKEAPTTGYITRGAAKTMGWDPGYFEIKGAPHITREVNYPYHAKDLGPMEDVALPSIRQYPPKQQAIPSIDKLIAGLLTQGILIKFQSPCNTPILAVPKPGKPNQYRLVQDLRSINAIVQPLHALVPNPAHILAQVPATAKVFAVVDLQHAFFALPLDPSSQYLFAFTYKGQQYMWTRLPQGFVNSPTLFSRCLQEQLQTLTLKQGSALVQYVDDLLIASPDEQSNRKDTAQLLNHLSSLGYIVSQSKVLLGQQRVKFLGVMLSATERSLERSRIEPICQFPVPHTAKEVRQWMGMVNYCRQSIPNIALDTKLLTPYTSLEGKFQLDSDALGAFKRLNEALSQAPALGRPLYDRPFQLYSVSGTLLATWWHPMLQALAQSISSRCLICQQYNPGKGVPCEWGTTPLPEGPFETLQMDFIELQRCQGYKYVLVIVDVFSKWIEAYPTTDNKASTVVKVLMKEIIPRYGIPNQLSSDNGPHFVGQVNKEFCTQMGIKQQLHCAYRPQAAGLVERANQTLKYKLAKLQAETGTTWLKLLPIALFQIRTTPAGVARLSPAE